MKNHKIKRHSSFLLREKKEVTMFWIALEQILLMAFHLKELIVFPTHQQAICNR